ncbi:MAG: DNA-binding protein WhiA [Defluviitaleaceae bacterium]|nr:DNA-binding protein WhiA [Defluviitaleaceae bacterium]
MKPFSKSFSQSVHAELLSDDNLEKPLDYDRAFVRECFLFGGIISNPGKTYHVEFTIPPEKADELLKILSGFHLSPKMIARKGQTVVYIKEAEGIADILNIIGAHKSLLELEEMRVQKNVRNAINRKVNFETANINKTVDAALGQIDAIKYIAQTVGLSHLPKPLKEIAELRLENETLSLTEIGELASPPLGKSGVNHRLRKICKIADNLQQGSSRK